MTEKRTAAERRDYMRQYHAGRKLGKEGTSTPKPVPRMPRCPAPHRLFIRDDTANCNHLRDRSGMLFWPERRHDFPETLEETLQRVK